MLGLKTERRLSGEAALRKIGMIAGIIGDSSTWQIRSKRKDVILLQVGEIMSVHKRERSEGLTEEEKHVVRLA